MLSTTLVTETGKTVIHFPNSIPGWSIAAIIIGVYCFRNRRRGEELKQRVLPAALRVSTISSSAIDGNSLMRRGVEADEDDDQDSRENTPTKDSTFGINLSISRYAAVVSRRINCQDDMNYYQCRNCFTCVYFIKAKVKNRKEEKNF